jgi:2-oxoglutarate dehydrogenase E2 component (dihydrolipoamide succinyltransferase)
MSEVQALRAHAQEGFTKKYGTKLGFMSFFVKTTVAALKAVPRVNGRIEGDDFIENNFYDIGVAVGTERGLVVPVVRDADKKSFADLEKDIADYAKKAREGKLKIEELQGGTFTISNGGVYGSLLSTPILNPPQSGILGMHKIMERPIAVNGAVVVRPMMYLALSYDHRLIDGKEAVTFLIKVKEGIESPKTLPIDF